MIPDPQMDPDYQSAIDPSYEAAIQRRRQAVQPATGWGPTPQLLAFALNRRLHLPEHRPYVPMSSEWMPDPRPYVPHVLDVLGALFRGLGFGRQPGGGM